MMLGRHGKRVLQVFNAQDLWMGNKQQSDPRLDKREKDVKGGVSILAG